MTCVPCVPLCVVPLAPCARACAAVIALIGVATAVLQSSIFGFASMFPPIYSQAVMSGQGFAGIVASVLRIVTLVCGVFPPCPPCRDGRGLWTQGWNGGGMWGAQHSTVQVPSPTLCDVCVARVPVTVVWQAAIPSATTAAALVYFILGCSVMVLCVFGYLALLRSDFAKHHLKKGSRVQPATVEDQEVRAHIRGAAPSPVTVCVTLGLPAGLPVHALPSVQPQGGGVLLNCACGHAGFVCASQGTL